MEADEQKLLKECDKAICAYINCEAKPYVASLRFIMEGIESRILLLNQAFKWVYGYHGSLSEWCIYNHIRLTTSANNSFKVVDTGYAWHTDITNFGLYGSECLPQVDAATFVRHLKRVVLVLHHGKFCLNGMEEVPASELEKHLSLANAAPSYFIDGEVLAAFRSNPRVEGLTRVRLLWDTALELEEGWQEKSKSSCSLTFEGAKQAVLYARGMYLQLQGLALGFDCDGYFTTQLPKAEHKKRARTKVTRFKLTEMLRTRDEWKSAVYSTALSDCPEGMPIAEFPVQVRYALYLMLCTVQRELGEQQYSLACRYSQDIISPTTARAAPANPLGKRNASRQLYASDIIASVGKPSPGKFRDKVARGYQTFDYLTVEITIITAYYDVAAEVFKRDRAALNALIMDRVCSATQIKKNPGLFDYLYVKEIQLYNAGRNATAWVEFKPGLENLLEGDGKAVSTMQLK